MSIVIINYGAGNIQSLKFACQRLGHDARLSSDPKEISAAEKVIFPGVGEAGSAMGKLRLSGLDKIIPKLNQPVLGICLGMQLMCNSSEEGNTIGLGIFDVDVKKFSKNVKVPQIGWNQIINLKSNLFKKISDGAFVYMVHSYFAPLSNETIAISEYDLQYSAALVKNNFYGTQFHPEKSSDIGSKILENFLRL